MSQRCDCDRTLNVLAWAQTACFSVLTASILYLWATAGRPERQWYRWEPGEHTWMQK